MWKREQCPRKGQPFSLIDLCIRENRAIRPKFLFTY